MTIREILDLPSASYPENVPDFESRVENEEGYMKVELWVVDGVVSAARLTTDGGDAALACARLAEDALVGKTRDDIVHMSRAFAFYNIDDLPNDKIFWSPMTTEVCQFAASKIV